ncbi:MAG: GTP cyclohydrolase II, partial [Alphaproteobacteria bacterium]|nr:GTP cyclohydrolase II [Alphaproteobacteria bacterium]
MSGASSPERRAAQAVDALRHGWPLAFAGGPTLLPVETAIASGASAPHMLIPAARATTLKLANQRDAAVPHAPVLIAGGEDFTMRDALPIADPALDLGNPLK